MARADATRAGVDQAGRQVARGVARDRRPRLLRRAVHHRELREAMLTGQLVDWRTGDAAADDPAHGAGWGAKRTVDAGLLAELLTSAKGPRQPRALQLAGAHIVGQLNLEATELVCPLLLRGCSFTEEVVLAEAQAPAVRLPGCHLPKLFAPQLTTRGNLILNEGFTATGEVNLVGAQIGGKLSLRGATLTNPGRLALSAERLTVHVDMVCREWFKPNGKIKEFKTTGEVNLLGAHIGGNLDLDGATLDNPNGLALNADRLTVGQDMVCREGFTATGEVNLIGAHIGGNLDLDGATLKNPNPDRLALDLQDANVGALVLRPATAPSRVNLTQTKVGVLNDDADTWPGKLRLVGFAYDALAEQPAVRAQERLAWLRRDPGGYNPQPYEQLAAVYRRAGHDQDARTVAIAKQRARRRTLGPAGRLWSLLLDGLVGYGYRTWLAGVWLVGFWLIGWAVFDRAHANQELVLAKPGEAHPSYHGAVYSIDTLLPVVDLRQEAVWIPRAGAQWWAWAAILAGWILTTAVVAALTGLTKRE